MLIQNLPNPLSTWRHHNGNEYLVLFLTNLMSNDHLRYPIEVIYASVNSPGVWSRKADDWHRSMTLIEDYKPTIESGKEPLASDLLAHLSYLCFTLREVSDKGFVHQVLDTIFGKIASLEALVDNTSGVLNSLYRHSDYTVTKAHDMAKANPTRATMGHYDENAFSHVIGWVKELKKELPARTLVTTREDKAEYTESNVPESMKLPMCPVCGSRTKMYDYVRPTDGVAKVVMCDNGDLLGDESHDITCPLYFPPYELYAATQREALTNFINYADIILETRKRNHDRPA